MYQAMRVASDTFMNPSKAIMPKFSNVQHAVTLLFNIATKLTENCRTSNIRLLMDIVVPTKRPEKQLNSRVQLPE